MTLADRIVVLRAGLIEQVGTPLELYNHPANLFVAGFIGSPRMNFLAAQIITGTNGDTRVRSESGLDLPFPAGDLPPSSDNKVTVGIRPENIRIVDPRHALLTGEVQIAEHLGGETFLYITLASGETVVAEVRGQAAVTAGERVGIEPDTGAAHIFANDGMAISRRVAGTEHDSTLA
jgi:multiple sugar transport system ATP-binding protein